MTSYSVGEATPMDVPRRRVRRRWPRYAAAIAVIAMVVAVGFALKRLRAAAPTVDKATVWIDRVKRGSMVREVQGQGTLVPEDIHWITAAAAAQVDQILVRPGTPVSRDTLLMVLTNPDLELAALEAERQLASTQSDLVNLRASLDAARLSQQSQVATLQSELGDAHRRAAADDDLAKRGFLSELERGQSSDRESELIGRLAFEQKRLEALARGHSAQLAAQEQQVERQRAIAEVRRRQFDELRVRAGADGVLEQMPLQLGQAVEKGALLAKVARPDKLKAEIRVPEVQAKDVQIGLPVSIDTHAAVASGHVSRIDPAVQSGFVKVDAVIDGELPVGARPDLSITATILLEKLDNVLFVSRPTGSQSDQTLVLFRLEPETETAVRTPVRLGRASVKTIEVLDGLQEGDQVIVSDVSQWSSAERLLLR